MKYISNIRKLKLGILHRCYVGGYNKIGIEGIKVFVKHMHHIPKLEGLGLGRNVINNYIANNVIKEEGAQILAESLQLVFKLKEINLCK